MSVDASKPRRRKKFIGSSTCKPKPCSVAAVDDPISADLARALAVLPPNYTFEIPKTLAMIRTHNVKVVGLQMPEGLQMFACVVGDLLQTFSKGELEVVILGDVTYGACCVDDYTARALGVELLVHYGHSCLVPLGAATEGIRTLYVFVEIGVDGKHAEETVKRNLPCERGAYDAWLGTLEGATPGDQLGTQLAIEHGERESLPTRLALVSTIQFASALSELCGALGESGYATVMPRAYPLSPGEILGCTAPTLTEEVDGIVYVGDGRFHLEAMMLANAGVPAFRYDPYAKKLTREGYDWVGMRRARKAAVDTAGRTWGIILGTLGRQGSAGHLEGLMKMNKQGIPILLSELSPWKLALFGEHVTAFVQTSCPRLSIDWGSAFHVPLLSVYEAGVALDAWREEVGHPMDFYNRDSRWAQARKTGVF